VLPGRLIWRHLSLLSSWEPPVRYRFVGGGFQEETPVVGPRLGDRLSLPMHDLFEEASMLPSRVIPFAEPSVKASSDAARPQLVQIGRDRELLRLRAKIIHSAGYTVHSIVP